TDRHTVSSNVSYKGHRSMNTRPIWINMRLGAPAEDHGFVLMKGVAPFLRRIPVRAYFVPEPESACINICIETSDRDDPQELRAGLLDSLREGGLARRKEKVQLEVGGRTSIHQAQINGDGAQDLIEDFLCDTSPFILDLIDQTKGAGRTRTARAF